MDMIASGIEASKWGFGRYGFEPYVRSSPENVVQALAMYWLEKCSAIRRIEDVHEGSCYRIYYEALVSGPEVTLRQLCDFLSVGWDDAMLAPRLGDTKYIGHGDYKVHYTESVQTSSVGRGSEVPVDRISPMLVGALNELLAELKYPPIFPDWNAGNNPFQAKSGSRVRDKTSANSVISLLEQSLKQGASGAGSWRLIIEGQDLTQIEVVVDFADCQVKQASGVVAPTYAIATKVTDLLAIAGGENVASVIRRGGLRIAKQGTLITETEIQEVAIRLAALLRSNA
jgi:hypothetical protein